ncbi:cadmium-translocating P-type ATPase [Virgibacillus pantothenticus]|uniref:heavy metal translocating P-type ATPase n=1 Tax=Virgibacillus pantothenticus TaxID=1473 RepID=UPI001C243900|nr:heavy metal translocating P-type ATPase [Virgibacillus pantothenticus]MBU8567273.1 cadmium-translocating P-type ATPase [Virgibacillus pantothenticus]MBU8600028.1 cadmium-translocating P-type ATPase [Virgibacillus pantothenticus]MBU8635391.1 cadmium-translocating P-type ATPase [Virgibacillus pantothenticus]MBU8642324.1 cadmium-translocating P-type ATPase [Virgibacillus pantothenticus]MBU8646238.1 cadmium-translocating P-type ATPase [Virgibacillus pantothenticus]
MSAKTSSPHPSNTIQKISEHKELIAALFSGLLIAVTWSLEAYLSQPLWVILHLIAFIIGGYAKAKEGITETIRNKDLNVEMLMIFAAIGAAAIGYWTEGAILIFIFALSGALETYTMNKSNKEISSLMKLQPEEALRIDGEEKEIVPVSSLQINDIIYVRAGERIPADGEIDRGETSIDESAITGEAIPVRKTEGNEVLAGTVALDGSIYIQITKPANQTLFQQIIQMIQSAQEEKSPSQLFIEKFEGAYVKIVLVVVFFMMFIPYFLFDWTIQESIYRAMILLVVASPCALVASIMPATLSAISKSARAGVLFKGGVHIENIGYIQAIAFDKTGTLTNGKPEVTDFHIHPDYTKEEILPIAMAMEQDSTHPLAHAIVTFCRQNKIDVLPQDIQVSVFTLAGNGISAIIQNVTWEIGKPDYIGFEAYFEHTTKQLAAEGKTIVYVKKGDQVVALFALKDTVRNDSIQAIKLLKQQGIHTVMLTGDHELTAKAIAEEAGIDEYVANCLPHEKVEEIKKLKEAYQHVAMVGDGINDGPALATANIGIAMGEGTDVALETAEVVLMKNNLSRIINAIHTSQKMNRVVKQNIFFSLAVIAVLIASNFLQVLDMPLGVIGHEGSTILVILNGLRLLK